MSLAQGWNRMSLSLKKILLLLLLMVTLSTIITYSFILIKESKYGFTSEYFNASLFVNGHADLKELTNVCIARNLSSESNGSMITSYDSSLKDNSRLYIKFQSPFNSYFKYTWTIDHIAGQIPKGYNIINGTAFFVTLTNPNNIYHFLNDTFFPLYSTMHLCGRLHNNKNNYLVYASSIILEKEKMHPNSGLNWFLQFLYVNGSHDYFYNYPHGTCFTDAIFVQPYLYKKEYIRTPIDRLRNSTPDEQCPKKLAVIIKRQNRILLNIADVEKVIAEFGYDARTVILEQLSLQEQFMLMKCCILLVGVKGSGLQWGQFMPVGSSVIEIAWPSLFWMFYFYYLEDYGIKHYALEVPSKDVQVNWKEYEMHCQGWRRCKRFTYQERRLEILKHRNLSKKLYESDLNLYKFADVSVNTEALRGILEKVLTTSNKEN